MINPDDIYQEIAVHKATIAMGTVLRNLEAHKGFQELILDGYLNKEALRLVCRLGEVGIASEERADIQRKLDSIGVFANYLRTVKLNAEISQNSLPESEAVFAELHSERL